MKSEKYMLDKRGFLAKAALVFLLLSAIVRVVGGFLNRAALMEDRFMQVEFLLPIVCGVLLMICIPAFGKRGFWLSAIPVVCLCMAYVLRLFSYDNLLQVELPMRHVLPGIFGCMVLAAAYSATVFGARTKWLLFLLFVAALCGHVWFELVPAFREGGWFSVSPADGTELAASLRGNAPHLCRADAQTEGESCKGGQRQGCCPADPRKQAGRSAARCFRKARSGCRTIRAGAFCRAGKA